MAPISQSGTAEEQWEGSRDLRWRVDGHLHSLALVHRGRCRYRPAERVMLSVIGPRSPFVEPPHDNSLGPFIDSEFRWQAARMPTVSRRLLLERCDPACEDPAALIRELHLDNATASDVYRALAA